jgi:hypothetical protein
VLHVDKGGIEPGKTDDLDDLRVGDAAGMRAEREPACIHDPFDPVLLHPHPRLCSLASKIPRCRRR